MNIRYLLRADRAQFHSIEQAFAALFPEISRSFENEVIRMPEAGAGPGSIRKNLRYLKELKAKTGTGERQIWHITGHVNYMALVTGRQTVLTIHDIRSALKGSLPARLIKLLLWFWIPCRIVRRITVISEFSKGELRRLVPFAARKAVVVPNPVGPAFCFDPRSGDGPVKRVLVVGTKSNKNLERIFEALRGLDLELCIVGSLSEEQQALLADAGIRYENRTNLPAAELVQCYRDCDLLCFPSLYEGFGMPIIEAQATGRPVLSSNRGAMKEVAGDTACLVDPESVEAIRAGLLRIMEDAAYRKALVEKGLENVKRFRAESIAEQYMAVYRGLMKDA